MAFFEGLVVTEDDTPVEVTYVGATSYYVIDDQGFHRHIEARAVDRVVLAQFTEQIAEHRGEAAEAMLKLMGQDDLFTKAMVDATLRNLNLEQVLDQGLPPDARQWLGMMGFRVVIDLHGDVVHVDMPSAPADWDDE
ncbi:MAG: hypothetical protein CVU38_10375 [Chloroflexi bacterium HGW-Chloroflexi-1]|nr:MAG: hypothetical protein CVU38_10375 [Chloroflexi bacterium HGW-Chloroflexi-1]